jgi:citrate synthase
MAEDTTIVTGLGKAELHRILVRGYDLTEELVGHITFADMTYLMLVGRMPTEAERRMTDALLVILVEHGLVSSAIAARVTYSTAPEAIQACVAAAILGAGSVHLGSSEWCARMLVDALPEGTQNPDLDATAERVVQDYAARKQRIPGIGHRTHAEGDPRADRLFNIARETGVYGQYCELLQRVASAAGKRANRYFPVNVTGAIAATALDMGYDWQMTKAFAIIGRTLGAMAHIGEEIRQPLTAQVQALVRGAMVYQPNRTA